jgi:DNA-binding HxlR family transcriptional regulator
VTNAAVSRKNALSGNRAGTVRPPRSQRDADDLLETASTGCPLTAAINAIGGKWNLICLYWLDIEPRRFNELRRLMSGISHKVLAETLRDLEREGLIVRNASSAAAATVEYRLSIHGQSVVPLVHFVREWGRRHLDRSG